MLDELQQKSWRYCQECCFMLALSIGQIRTLDDVSWLEYLERQEKRISVAFGTFRHFLSP